MKSSYQRSDRVADVIRREVSDILFREVKDAVREVGISQDNVVSKGQTGGGTTDTTIDFGERGENWGDFG